MKYVLIKTTDETPVVELKKATPYIVETIETTIGGKIYPLKEWLENPDYSELTGLESLKKVESSLEIKLLHNPMVTFKEEIDFVKSINKGLENLLSLSSKDKKLRNKLINLLLEGE